jgi:hypothetical protein
MCVPLPLLCPRKDISIDYLFHNLFVLCLAAQLFICYYIDIFLAAAACWFTFRAPLSLFDWTWQALEYTHSSVKSIEKTSIAITFTCIGFLLNLWIKGIHSCFYSWPDQPLYGWKKSQLCRSLFHLHDVTSPTLLYVCVCVNICLLCKRERVCACDCVTAFVKWQNEGCEWVVVLCSSVGRSWLLQC